MTSSVLPPSATTAAAVFAICFCTSWPSAVAAIDTVTSFPVAAQQTPDVRRVAPHRDPLPYYMVEELPASTPIGCVPVDAALDRIYTETELRNVKYSFAAQSIAMDDMRDREPVELFNIDPSSGVIRTQVQIDRDRICSARQVCVVLLDVIVSPPQYFRLIRIAVDIIDINDHAPEFPSAEVEIRIPESVMVGTRYNLPTAVDRDGEPFAVKGYQLTLNSGGEEVINDTGPFRIVFDSKYNDLQLEIVHQLDREAFDSYRMLLLSRDGGEPVKTGSVLIKVTVDDDNDNVPVFDRPSYDFDVVENSLPGTMVGKVKATDADAGINGRVRYNIRTSDLTVRNFVIDPETGVLYVGSALDYERGAEYRLTIMATDMADDVDDDDEKETDSRTGSASSSGTGIKWDPFAGQVRINQRASPQVETMVTTTTMRVSSRSVIYGGDQRLVFGESNSLTSFAVVRIRVVDRNDNAPRVNVNTLRQPPDVAVVSESSPVGTFVAYVTASDADAGNNGQVVCSLRQGGQASVELFRLEGEPTSAKASRLGSPAVDYRLVTSALLDREQARRHVISIICRDLADGHEISRESGADVVVEVTDENDHTPRFDTQTYNCQVTENSAPGDVIAVVKATDEDHGINGQVRYRLQSGYEGLFDIDPDSGRVRTRVSFDREHVSSLTLAVYAHDLGVPRQLTATATLHLHVRDVDDHAPSFTKTDYTFAVLENQAPGTEIGRVTAIDGDAAEVNSPRFRYELLPEPSDIGSDDGVGAEFPLPFRIDDITGSIVTQSVLDRERRAEYRLRCVVHAQSGTHRSVSATAQVVIHVMDVNDNRPKIHWPPPPRSDSMVEPIRISSRAPVGHIVAVIAAEDPDIGVNGVLRYSVSDDAGLFGVTSPEEGRIVVLRPLSEASAVVRIVKVNIEVADCGSPRLSSSTSLSLVVDTALAFAYAHRTGNVDAEVADSRVGVGSTRTTVFTIILSCLTSIFVLLLVAVVIVTRQFLRDRKRYDGSGLYVNRRSVANKDKSPFGLFRRISAGQLFKSRSRGVYSEKKPRTDSLPPEMAAYLQNEFDSGTCRSSVMTSSSVSMLRSDADVTCRNCQDDAALETATMRVRRDSDTVVIVDDGNVTAEHTVTFVRL